jgi:RNA polymerase sigma factor (sigma-70 family)
MAEVRPNPVLHHIRHLIGGVPAAAMTDGQLLERFLASRDETAVEVLVRRYGPLVLGACRRVLRRSDAAEDAFQATFLVLMRRAPALDRSKPLGSYLYTVAYRLALRARAHEARRRQCEARAARNRTDAEGHTPRPGDLIVALEEELHRLPERHRTLLVLCYLEGKTNEQAAEILGCPRGSMSARLAEARERLRQCLARRGFAVPCAGIGAVLAAAPAEAAVPVPLLADTVRAALWFVGAEADPAGWASSRAVALARGACRAMLVNKLKLAGAVLLAAAMLGTGATLLLPAAPQAGAPAPAVGEPAPGDRTGRLPTGAVARMGTTRLRHGDVIAFAAYTPDGRALVTAGRDQTVRLWDLETGEETRRFDWGEERPDAGPRPSREETAQTWERQFWDATARGCQAALSADGKMVAASRGGAVCLWETGTGKRLRQLQTGQPRLVQLAFSADGKSLLTLGPGQATAVWDVATGRCVRRSEGKPAAGAAIKLPALWEQIAVVSPGWTYLAWERLDQGGPDSSIHVCDLATGKELLRIKAAATALAFSPDARTLVWAPLMRGIVVSDVATGKELRRLGGDSANLVADIALSADGKALAVSRADHTLELWDLTSGTQTGHIGTTTDVDQVKSDADVVGALVRPALAFSPDGTRVVSSLGGPTIRQFRADTGAEVPGPGTGHRAPVSTLALSADGRSLWTHGQGDPLRCWDWATGKGKGQRRLPDRAAQVAFAADGRSAYAEGNKVTLCGADGAGVRTIVPGGPRVMALALSPDGALLATRSGSPREVRVWDATTGKERLLLAWAGDRTGGSDEVLAEREGVVPPDVVFSPDGRFLAGAGPARQLCLWDVASGQPLWELPPRTGQAIERFAFCPSGRCLATVDGDHAVTLYETLTGKKRGRLGKADPKARTLDLTGLAAFSYLGWRQDSPVRLAFSPDGRYLATAQETPEIHLWDVLAGREVGQLRGHEGGVVSLLWAADGRHLFSGGTDTTALTWDLTRLSRPDPAPAAKLTPAARDALWTDLAGRDAARAFEAVRRLSASPGQAVALVQERVRPATPADAERVARLLADLQSDRFEVRRQAELALEGLGEAAGPALRRALADEPPPDLRQRLQRLLDKLAGTAPPAGLARDLRAVEVLEFVATAEARQVLQTLADGVPGARLTREARNALQRLARQAVRP